MGGLLLQNGKQSFTDANSRPLVGGQVFFYSVGTSTPKDTWQDAAQVSLNTNPVILNARGEASIYGVGTYRQVLKDALGNLIWDQVITDPGEAANNLSGTNGASLIGWNGGQVSEFLDGGWFQPNDLDLTGVADEGAKIIAYLNKYKRVRLPAGRIRGRVIVPSYCSITGAGCTDLNRTTKVWGTGGTTLVGSLEFTGSVGCTGTRMNVDAYGAGGNAIAGVSDSTSDVIIANVNTRGSDHNQLWEQNGTDPAGGKGGNILVMDCKGYDGPNGFVSKMKNVTFLRCFAYDTTIQAFVVASDNINGSAIYSRATKTRIQGCGGDGNYQGVTVYSRDVFSETNANGVYGTQDTYIDVTFTKIGNCSVHVGFYTGSTTGFTRLYNDNVVITGGNYSATTPLFHIRFDDAARPRVTGGYFYGVNAIVYGDFCVDPVVTSGVQTYLASNGVLTAQATAPLNTAAVNVDIAATRMSFKNTAPVNILAAALVSSAARREIDLMIDDSFTSVVIGSQVIRGIGTWARLGFDSLSGVNSGWRIISAGSTIPVGKVAIPYTASLAFSWPSLSCNVVMGGAITNFAPNATSIYPGARLSMVFINPTGGALAISAYTGVLFGTIGILTSVPAAKQAMIQFEWDGNWHVVTSVNVY